MRFWRRKSNLQTVRNFIHAINSRDFDGISALLDKNCRLIDSSGKAVTGSESCIQMLRRIADVAPDYQLELQDLIQRGDDVLVSGRSISSNTMLASATQWRARATNTHLLEWQSYSPILLPSLEAMMRDFASGSGSEASLTEG